MADASAKPWPVVNFAEATARLTAPGAVSSAVACARVTAGQGLRGASAIR